MHIIGGFGDIMGLFMDKRCLWCGICGVLVYVVIIAGDYNYKLG